MTASHVQAQEYLTIRDFIAQQRPGAQPTVQRLWLTHDIKATASRIMERSIHTMRVPYWQLDEQTTVWTCDEIGKEKPITMAFLIEQQQIMAMAILAFRESRGYQVRYPFFTEQFQAMGLMDDRTLTKRVDGISGATMSVRAVKRCARLSLYYAQQIP